LPFPEGTNYPVDRVAQGLGVHGTRHDLPSVRQDGEAEKRHPPPEERSRQDPQEDAIISGVLEQAVVARDSMNDVEEPVRGWSLFGHGISSVDDVHSAQSKRGAVFL
jgi:hypothetical protein